MKILLQGRVDVLKKMGGDSTLMMDIAKELTLRKIHCYINDIQTLALSKFDIIHFFGIMRVHDLYPYFLQAKKQQKKIIVTPIYEDLSYLDRYGRVGLERFAANILPNDLKEVVKGLTRGIRDIRQLKSAFLQFKFSYSKQQRDILMSADHILATSYGEMSDLQKKFAIPKSRFSIVPICINKENYQVSKDLFVKKYGLRNFVISVGRIEPKKNQLGLIDALRDSRIPLIFIGNTNPYHKSYISTFFKKIKGNFYIRYLGMLERPMLLSSYAAAKVHVLASWFEVLGLSSLEAAVNGCNIVTTDKGYAREYFKDLAWYCDPQDPESIRRSVVEAYYQPVKKGLKDLMEEKYTWDKIVPKILEVYKDALKK